jgi:hypothetical protein
MNPLPIATAIAAITAPVQDVPEEVVVQAPSPGLILDLLSGGIMIYPVLGCALLVLGIGAWTSTRLWGSEIDLGPRTRAGVDSVLFWGAFAVVLGVLGTLIGVMVAAHAIEAVGEVHATLVWGGIRLALITTVTGVLVLALAALLWFFLNLRYRRLATSGA